MIHARTLGAGIFVLMLTPPTLNGQATLQYRDFQLGGDLASVSALAGISASDATVVHQRPAVLQDLVWRRPFARGGETAPQDSAKQILFSFYNNQLFRVVVDYDADRTQGMTDADMIESFSAVYGPIAKPLPKASRVTTSQIEAESGAIVARWLKADHSAVLFRSFYPSSFRLVVTALPLEGLALNAVAQAQRLDEREAPQRELARQKKEADEEEASRQKAREANKATFRP